VAESPGVEVGVGGASARREHERRKATREARIRTAHPRIGGLVLALSDDPQSTTAWAVGVRGEELLAKSLDGLADQGVLTLHDRRIPGTLLWPKAAAKQLIRPGSLGEAQRQTLHRRLAAAFPRA
jgi:hypothetical protein